QNFPDIELTLNQQLRDFFDYYSQQGRPIEFLAGAWESKRFHSEASIKALFGMLKSEPTLILESEFDGGYLNFRTAYWTIGQPNYSYQTIIARLSYQEILYNSAKTRALTWKNTKDKLMALGKTQAEIEKRGGDNEINLKIWEEEQSLREAGIEDDELEIHYKINRKHFEDLYQFLITCHCLVAGWIADTHHLFLHDLTPLLPQLLPDLTQNIPEGEVTDEVVGVVISGYEKIYEALAVERSHWVPELMLKLAQGLVNLPNQSWAKTQLLNSVEYWLRIRNPRNPVSQRNRVSEESQLWDAVNSVVTAQDLDYIENVNNLLETLGETHRVNIVEACYQRGQNHCQQGEYSTAIDDFTQVLLLETNSPDANYNRGLAYSKLGQYQAAIEDYNQSLQLNPNYAEAYNNRGNAYYKLGEYEKAIADYNSRLALNPNLPGVAHNRDVFQGVLDEKRRREREFEFDVITVNAEGKETHRERRRAEFFKEDLGNNISLEMISIPGGTFMMGVAQNEASASSDEYPQHLVNIAAFSMAKYPITQAQWEAIMGNNPSSFKGANRPVENVTWHEAQEFCQRLSQKTGKTYRLPSEAEWEYACRAGTTTPFHFGETITVDLANYDAKYRYASAPTGTYRQQTTDVGSFPPNAFGLYDMHGNVWEWCADPWHENYDGAPTDGSVWEWGGNTQYRVIRGGSWVSDPGNCRCAFRIRIEPDGRYRNFGFRVVSFRLRGLCNPFTEKSGFCLNLSCIKR
ncbi:MAG: SUMF1/EgtB/PvdO family nonheme iron enzyme, partial [Planktothrix sp.]|uniref:SUMF1/EgtB/PvdO family nonheme iron enzyme n=1 Tax=Planktothrix sp. TaxID=3088171 RepID=UPI0038D3E405